MEVQVAATASTRASWPYLQYVLKGIRHTAGRSPSEYSPPQTSSVALAPSSGATLRTCTSSCGQWHVVFFGFMCMGEVTTVPGTPSSTTADGVAVDSHATPNIIWQTLTRPKTDQLGRGSTIFLGKTGTDLCPVEPLLQFLVKHPGPRTGPLFIREDWQSFHTGSIHQPPQRGPQQLNRRYSGHSFRIGAATWSPSRCPRPLN